MQPNRASTLARATAETSSFKSSWFVACVGVVVVLVEVFGVRWLVVLLVLVLVFGCSGGAVVGLWWWLRYVVPLKVVEWLLVFGDRWLVMVVYMGRVVVCRIVDCDREFWSWASSCPH